MKQPSNLSAIALSAPLAATLSQRAVDGNGGRRLVFDGACEVAILAPGAKALWSSGTQCATD